MDYSSAAEIFNEVIEVPPEEWPAILDRTCAGNATLRAEVDSLLRTYRRHPPPPKSAAGTPLPERVGRYKVLGELGRGGMGRVYLAEDPTLGRRIALKMLPAHLINEPEQFARFHREAQILARLNHPNVATLYSLEQSEGTPFLTMELVTGDSLAALLAASPTGTGLPLARALHIGVQMARALQAAHERGIVHRDLKPANVAVAADGAIKVLDFGLAKVIGLDAGLNALDPSGAGPADASGTWISESRSSAGGSAGETQLGAILGSPGYMSPEQIRGDSAGPASDLWAFGCILFECLAGRRAFPGSITAERMTATLEGEPDWSALPTQMPRRLRSLVRQCLLKDPAQRPASAERLGDELKLIAAAVGEYAVPGDGTSPGSWSSSLLGRGRTQRLLRLLAAAALTGILIWISVSQFGERRSSRSVEGRSRLASADADAGEGGIVSWGHAPGRHWDIPLPNERFVAIAAGNVHSLALKADGTIVAWGSDFWGQRSVPAPPSDFVAVAAGANHSLGLKSDGRVVAWGWNDGGQCNVPLPNANFVAISAGRAHSLALRSDSSIVAWGSNKSGQLDVPAPNTGFIAIDAGDDHSLGLRSDGSIAGWGDNTYHQLDVPSPNRGFVAVSAGARYSMGLLQNASIVAWGDNTYGQLDVPPANFDIVKIAAGSTYGLALTTNWSIKAWGRNDRGQYDVPQSNVGFAAIAAGGGDCLALKSPASPDPPNRGGAASWRIVVAPNPVLDGTRVSFSTARATPAIVEVIDAMGRPIRRIEAEPSESGLREVWWDGFDHSGHRLQPGFYFVRARGVEAPTGSEKIVVYR